MKQFVGHKTAPEDNPQNALASLTERERMVFRMIAQGHTNKSMAQEMEISPRTVEKHRASLMQKLNAPDLASLMQIAIRAGLYNSQD